MLNTYLYIDFCAIPGCSVNIRTNFFIHSLGDPRYIDELLVLGYYTPSNDGLVRTHVRNSISKQTFDVSSESPQSNLGNMSLLSIYKRFRTDEPNKQWEIGRQYGEYAEIKNKYNNQCLTSQG